MAENQQPVRGETPEKRLILMPSGSSSKEMSASGDSEHPNSLGHAWCPCAPPHDGTVCRNCYSDGQLSTGVPDRQNNQQIRAAQWDDGKNWSGSTQADPARGWRRSMGWKERQRDERGRFRKGDNWQGKQEDFRKSWSNQRKSLTESTPWSSGSLNRKREATSFGEPSLNLKQKQDGNCWPEMCDGSKGQRYLTHAQIEWQKNQGPQEPASFIDNTAAAQMTSTTGQDKREDWEAEYKSTQETSSTPECSSSLQSKEMNTSEAGDSYDVECVPSTDQPKQILESSPQFPNSVSQGQAATPTEMEPTASDSNWKKNTRLVHYLQSLYSDVPEKSSSECSADLPINIDAEESKPEEEEEATKSASDGELKLLE